MSSILAYLFQSGLCLAVFYLGYELFLKRETFFQLNRIYLVSGLWLSFVIPAFPVVSPFRTLVVTSPGSFSPVPVSSRAAFDPSGPLLVLYGAGVLLFLLRFAVQLAKLRRVVRTHGIRRLRGVKIVAVDRLFSPFSFFDIIFLNPGPSPDADLRRILAHEQVHIRQQHSLDVLLMEVVLSLQWFNPFVWPYKKALQETHEYLADSGVIAQGFSSVRYQLHMFEQNVGVRLFEFGNNFKKSQIKRRITMLSRIKSPRAARLKFLLALPLIVGLVLVFAEPRLVAGPSIAQDKTVMADQFQEKTKVKEEFEKLAAMEKEIVKKLETVSSESEKIKLKKKLEMVLHTRQELAVKNGFPAGHSPTEFKALYSELKAKEAAVLAAFEKSTDETEKAKLKETLIKIREKQEFLKIEAEKASGLSSSQPSVEKMKDALRELQAKEADVREKLAKTTDPGEKAKLEDLLKKIGEKRAQMKIELEKTLTAGVEKTEKTVK